MNLEIIVPEELERGPDRIRDASGHFEPGKEVPERTQAIVRGLERAGGRRIAGPLPSREELASLLAAVHAPAYLEFLEGACARLEPGDELYTQRFSAPDVKQDTPLTRNAFERAKLAAAAAVAAARRTVVSRHHVYAVTRPPGHHAGPDYMGGYCYLNNAVLAADTIHAGGIERVGIVDVDYHFCNGTAALVPGRDWLFLGSIHADPVRSFPYMEWTHQSDRQTLVAFEHPPTTADYVAALGRIMQNVLDFKAQALVVSVGFDVLAGDPHGTWRLPPAVFAEIGKALVSTGLPLCLLQEGGYLLDQLEGAAHHFCASLKGEVMEHDPPLSLDDYRVEVDRLDGEILRALEHRLFVCRLVADWKAKNGVPMMQTGRLATVRERCITFARERGISEEMVEQIYAAIFAETCRLEDEIIARRQGKKEGPCDS